MKRLAYLLLTLMLFAACTHTSHEPWLVAADSLLLSRPDSALTLLRAMTFSSTADRMYHQLLLADASNKCYDTLPPDSILREVADFYDRHGSANEQLRAHYLLGCAYRDMGEAPQALQCYQDAIDRADTLAADCDFYTLSRVHSQMAALLGEQMLPRQQLEELQQQYYYAFRIQDTLCVLNAMGQMTNAYNMLEQTDSAALIAKNLVEIYTKKGYYRLAAIYSGEIAALMTKNNQGDKIKGYLNFYESRTGFFDKEGNIEKGREFYYGVKGRYFLAVCRYDSAEYYFKKEIENAEDLNNREYAYRGLYMLYKQTGQQDSMSRYAQLAYETTDAHFQEKQSDELRHMQSLYNYSRYQTIARNKTIEANNNRMLLLSLAFVFIIFLISGFLVFFYYRNKKKAQLIIIQQRYEHDLERLEQAKYDLLKIQEEKTNHLKIEKETEIAELKKRLATYYQSSETEKELEEFLSNTEIYIRLRYLVMHPQEKISIKEMQALEQMMEEKLPAFRSTLYKKTQNLKPSDYELCMLDRLHFSPSEMAVLTGNSLSAVTMKRVRLLKKIFQISGKGSHFDVLIRNIE